MQRKGKITLAVIFVSILVLGTSAGLIVFLWHPWEKDNEPLKNKSRIEKIIYKVVNDSSSLEEAEQELDKIFPKDLE